MPEKTICSDWVDAKPAFMDCIVLLDEEHEHSREDTEALRKAPPPSLVVFVESLCGPLLPWQIRYLAELEAERKVREHEVIHGKPGGMVPTGILTLTTTSSGPGMEKRSPILQQEPWRRQGKRRGRR